MARQTTGPGISGDESDTTICLPANRSASRDDPPFGGRTSTRGAPVTVISEEATTTPAEIGPALTKVLSGCTVEPSVTKVIRKTPPSGGNRRPPVGSDHEPSLSLPSATCQVAAMWAFESESTPRATVAATPGPPWAPA